MNYNVDYYQILEISKTATEQEIKKQFRKLAREYHPDHAGDSQENADRFAQIREAYEILSDPELRERYDNPPQARPKIQRIHKKRWKPPSGMRKHTQARSETSHSHRKKRWKDPANQVDINDILGMSTGGRLKKTTTRINQQSYRRVNAVDGEDIELDVDVPVNIAHNGGSILVEYKRKVRGESLSLIAIDEIQYLRIGPNTQNGEKLTIPKLGHAGENGGVYGDLICTVSITSPKAREESESQAMDQHQNINITIVEAILGGRVEVDTATGIKKISIPAGTSSGRKLRLREVNHKGGDLILTVQIIVPKNLDAESLELIRKFGELNPDSPR